ncbi:MAG: cryptochrome/photolyase family protein [Lewinellaceae bacterium]|nr:cryptochrome/photolyase family protein [Saprospiraceae bacterium]MCB9338891.1 cryptochrome/photolyase family protein [Lewinellaceae bacterium]
MKTLRLLLGDQLNRQHSWFEKVDGDVLYCFFEMRQETDYVQHHLQKVIGFFAAMRAFAEELREVGHSVVYVKLDDEDNRQSLEGNLLFLIKKHGLQRFEYQLPDEWRLDVQLKEFCGKLDIEAAAFDTEHFMTKREAIQEFFGKKNYLMETFYRDIRRRHGILMEGGKPVGGQWNFDAENRKKMPKEHRPPEPLLFEKDLSDIAEMIDKAGVKTIGTVDAKHFIWPTNREESLELLAYFTQNLLEHFGDFQDALTPEYWALYHSRLSFALNTKMISPLEVVQQAVQEWEGRKDEISIAQVEGFVRQIIGWREYMRGIYWAKMPAFAQLNFFGHQRKLPGWFWTGNTKMACLRHAIGQSLQYAYAHHIQRLMVTGNFALLAGIHPDEVDAWYLGIYIDAIEWVEITNTRGMSQFADGGIVGTKPYCSSANYIDKMGHYCNGCYYDKKLRTGENSCPFNSLYWDFYDRHRDKLENNPRIGMMYRTWDKMAPEDKEGILKQAAVYLENIASL